MLSKSNKKDLFMWIGSILLLIVAGINQKEIYYNHILLQFVITISLAGGGIFLLLQKTTQGKKFWQYWLSAIEELKKVTWPNKKETMQTTLAVVIMVIVMGLALWVVDSILIRLVAWLLTRGIN